MRNFIFAGVSAIALITGGGGLALAAGTSTNPNSGSGPGGSVEKSQTMEKSQGAGASTEAQSSSNQIEQAQQRLKSEGLYKGKVDGIDGPQTQHALKQFQQKNDLKQTGQVDQQTEAKLGMGEGSGTSTPPAGAATSGKNVPAQAPGNSGEQMSKQPYK